MATELLSILLVAFSSVLAAFSPILLKKASMRDFNFKSLITNYPLYGAAILYALGIGTFVFALRKGELSVLYPISSLGYIWASLGGVKFLGERMNKFKWIGIFLIILGVSFIGIGGK